jgi:hypothetical protein
MKTKVLALLLLAGSCVFAGPRVFFGVGIGVPAYGYYAPPPPVPVYTYAAPAYAATLGFPATIIRLGRAITGTRDIGPIRRIGVPHGLARATMAAVTTAAIGGDKWMNNRRANYLRAP